MRLGSVKFMEVVNGDMFALVLSLACTDADRTGCNKCENGTATPSFLSSPHSTRGRPHLILEESISARGKSPSLRAWRQSAVVVKCVPIISSIDPLIQVLEYEYKVSQLIR